MAVAKKNAVAVKEDAQLPTTMGMFEEDSGVGFENATADDYAIPRLVVLQKGSPQCDPDVPGEYLPDAKPGMFFNTVTRELFDGDAGLTIVPIEFRRSYIEWVPRESGGGFVAEHSVESGIIARTTRNEKGQDILPNGNQIVDTRTHYVFLVKEPGIYEPVIISLTSTQGKKSKQWMTSMRSIRVPGSKGPFNPPMFGQLWHVSTVPEQNDKGSWRGWHFDWAGKDAVSEGLVSDPGMYSDAKAFKESIAAGAVKADYEAKPENATEAASEY